MFAQRFEKLNGSGYLLLLLLLLVLLLHQPLHQPLLCSEQQLLQQPHRGVLLPQHRQSLHVPLPLPLLVLRPVLPPVSGPLLGRGSVLRHRKLYDVLHEPLKFRNQKRQIKTARKQTWDTIRGLFLIQQLHLHMWTVFFFYFRNSDPLPGSIGFRPQTTLCLQNKTFSIWHATQYSQ